eukprot:9682019-Karenia_brevis.AAC.1
MTPQGKLERVKPLLRDAAMRARDAAVDEAGSTESKDLLLATVARCFSQNNFTLLKRLWKKYQAVREQ